MKRKSKQYEFSKEFLEDDSPQFRKILEIVEALAEKTEKRQDEVMRDIVRCLYYAATFPHDTDANEDITPFYYAMECATEVFENLGAHYLSTKKECLSKIFEYYSANLKLGQVFTPWFIVDLMCGMVLEEYVKNNQAEVKDTSTPFNVLEPACGCGRFLIGMKRAAEKYALKKPICIIAIDIDEDAFKATVVNSKICGINAVVIHGNTLTGEFWKADSVIGGFICRLPNEIIKKILGDFETLAQRKGAENGQLQLF